MHNKFHISKALIVCVAEYFILEKDPIGKIICLKKTSHRPPQFHSSGAMVGALICTQR